MKARKIETIVVEWSLFGNRRRREFNSSRLADELVASLVRDAGVSPGFGKIRRTATVEWVLDAAG